MSNPSEYIDLQMPAVYVEGATSVNNDKIVSEDQPPPYESLPLRPAVQTLAGDEESDYSYTEHHPSNRAANTRPGELVQGRQPPPYADAQTTSPGHYTTPQLRRGDTHVYRPVERYAEYTGPDELRLSSPDDYELYECPQPEGNEESTPPVPSTEGRRAVLANQLPANVMAYHPAPPPKPKTWLPWSIVTLVILCLPLGIPATILSACAKKDFENGRRSAGEKKATAAFVLNIIGTVIGGLLIISALGVTLFVVVILAYCCNN